MSLVVHSPMKVFSELSDEQRPPSPPAKRRRLVVENERTHDASMLVASRPFWFQDGDIVLEVQQYRFKIHQHRLRCSLIFSDMLELPQPEEAENVDGCPLVALADAANDWLAVLKWMYSPDEFMNQPIVFDVLSGALRISTKYEMGALREWGIRELYSRWPQYPDLDYMDLNALPHVAEAISLAQECDVPEILPAAFYALSVQRWSCNADGGRSHLVLTPADLRRLIAGREQLQDFLLQILMDPLTDNASNSNFRVCDACRPLLERYWRMRLAPNPAAPWRIWLLRELGEMVVSPSPPVCMTCVIKHRTLIHLRKAELKKVIPRFFSL